MQISAFITLLASAAIAHAGNTIKFQSLDNTGRTIYWTGNPGAAAMPPTEVPGGQTVTVDVPQYWAGNYYSVSDGAPNVPGMLGEVAFQAWGDITYFDVSAIVNPADHVGVMTMYPEAAPNTPVSGCTIWPCNNAYYAPDDIQTKAMNGGAIVTTLGGSGSAKREADQVDHSANFPRDALSNRMFMPRQ